MVPGEDCSLCTLIGVAWMLHVPFNPLYLSLLLCKTGGKVSHGFCFPGLMKKKNQWK